MSTGPLKHFRATEKLARALNRRDIYDWLVMEGYFPEPYVLPPCFHVVKHRAFGAAPFPHTKTRFKLPSSELTPIHFPRTDWTDRAFGIIDPLLHSGIAHALARNWTTVLNTIFDPANRVASYSFPIPLDSRNRGKLGTLRAGRFIYEFIEMAEHDLAAEAFRYKCVFRTDVKNFYPSLYTHSIAWALHGKRAIRKSGNRHNYTLVGNRLDRLFHYANDECTNGIPIGPAVSDLIGEIVLSAVDREVSKRLVKEKLADEVVIVRFKDDYRILAKAEPEGRTAVKTLQAALREYRLELNEDKTECHTLPDGIFREWVSKYNAANPRPKSHYDFKRFKEVYLAVVAIDRAHPGTGVIDKFLADLVAKDYRLRVSLAPRSILRIVSLLLVLARLRTKALPKALAIIEAIISHPLPHVDAAAIGRHLSEYLDSLMKRQGENVYAITWIGYFIRANGLEGHLKQKYKVTDPVARAAYTSRFIPFVKSKDFKVFRGVRTARKKVSLLEHLDVFRKD